MSILPSLFLWFLIIIIAILHPYRRHRYSVSDIPIYEADDLKDTLNQAIAVKGKQDDLISITPNHKLTGRYFITYKRYWSLGEQISHNYWGFMNKEDEYPKTYFFCYLAFYVIFGILTHILFPNVTEYLWEQIEYLNLV